MKPLSETYIDKSTYNDEKSNLKKKLMKWSEEFSIKSNAFSSLLKILKGERHPTLPADCRTLLKTVRKSNLIQNHDGSQMTYFGIVKNLLAHDLKKICNGDKDVKLKINIDGLPISKSTGDQFWPILCQVVSKYKISPFLVACYWGKTKPKSVDDFLDCFIKEMHSIKSNGFNQDGTSYNVAIHSIVCDARVSIKCIKGHGGYYGCERCVQKGLSVNRRVFLENKAEKRTDDSFKFQTQEEHYIGTSPLLKLDASLITKVPLDYMHLVVLGAMRKLLLYWIRKGDCSVRIGMTNQISLIFDKLVSLSKHTPSEFSRKPRSLKEVDRYKATELRQTLFYTGPVVFRHVLPDHIYNHFLVLHVAISTLANDVKVQNESEITYAENLLIFFVQEMEKIYKQESIVYNIHNLIHFADDVRRFGCLDKFSCFPFENFLFQLKSTLRTPNRPFSQLCRRESEKRIGKIEKDIPEIELRGPRDNGPSLTLRGRQFQKVTYNGSKISTIYLNDSFVQLSNQKIVKVANIINTGINDDPESIFLICNQFSNYEDYYSYPCSSKRQSIYKIGKPSNKLIYRNIKCVTHICLVSSELKVAIFLIHEIF